MYELKFKLIKNIGLLEYLIYIENFQTYQNLLKKHHEILTNIKDKENISELKASDLSPYLNVMRIYLEAPPSDKKLGKYILEALQDFYELQEKILNV